MTKMRSRKTQFVIKKSVQKLEQFAQQVFHLTEEEKTIRRNCAYLLAVTLGKVDNFASNSRQGN